jgi:hypothetical protein
MHSKHSIALVGLALTAVIASPAFAEVPTAADFAACNMKAAEDAAADTASASPPTATEKRAGQLPPDAKTVPPSDAPRSDIRSTPSPAGKAGTGSAQRDPTGNTVSSDKDPQVQGMSADRANDKSYVAAYRSCMRQRGF